MRRIATGRRNRPVGLYYSVKNGRGVPWESHVEERGMFHAEVDTSVLRYYVQPHTLRIIRNGLTFNYTPDREDRHQDGMISIIEIKDVYREKDDLQYFEKLRLAAEVYARLGYVFRIVQRGQIDAEPLFSAVETIQAYRRTAVSIADVAAIRNCMGDQKSTTVLTATEALGGPDCGLHRLSALVVRRMCSIDLRRGLVADAEVTMVTRLGGVIA